GLLGLPEGGRYTDEDDVALLQSREVRGRGVPAGPELHVEIRPRHVGAVGLAEVERGHPVGIAVETGHHEAGAGDLDGEGQTHVALPDHGDAGRAVLNAVGQTGRAHDRISAHTRSWGSRGEEAWATPPTTGITAPCPALGAGSTR